MKICLKYIPYQIGSAQTWAHEAIFKGLEKLRSKVVLKEHSVKKMIYKRPEARGGFAGS